jgi:glycine/D-amino acid oxidase-like deaminating enzyme
VMNADALVIAAGAYVKRLVPELGAELRTNRKVNLYLQPPAALSGVWSNAPIVVDLGGDSAGVLIPPVAGTPIRFGLGQADRSVEVEHEVEVSALEAGQMLEFLEQSVLDFAGYRFVGSLSCHHVSSSDERFVLRGIAERTWVVSGCSGHMYKFGPLIGESMAAALGDSSGERDLLESFTNLGNAMQPA